MDDRAKRHSDKGTTRSPADRDVFGDDGPKVPEKDRFEQGKEKPGPTDEAGGVD
jgi:hypothetical protein